LFDKSGILGAKKGIFDGFLSTIRAHNLWAVEHTNKAMKLVQWEKNFSYYTLEFKGPVLWTAKRPETGLDWTRKDRTAVASCII
jgi:hypothetical protein